MYSGGYGMGYGSFFMWAIWLLVIFSIYALIKLFFNQASSSGDSSLEILKQRYARGEIDSVQFEKMKKELKDD
jgi:putative membrane protein